MSRHRSVIVLIVALAGLVAFPAIPAGAGQIECDDRTYYVIERRSETRDVLGRFRSENRSNSRTNCVGGRERKRRSFSGEAPASLLFSRDG